LSYLSLALSSAFLFGIWKFGLSFYRGRVSVYAVILLSALGAGAVYVILGAMQSTLVFEIEDVPEGLLGGALNFIGTLLILMAFARGTVGVVAGVGALYVLVPLGYSIVRGEQVTAPVALGVALLATGIVVFYAPHARADTSAERQASRAPILLALAAAAFYGLAIVVLDIGSLQSVNATLAMSQIPQIVLAAAILLLAPGESTRGVTGTAVAVIAGSGIAVALGNIAFFTAANEGDIGVVAVLGSLSPMVTALLAAIIFRERLTRSDYVAFAIVIVGAAFVAA
jgi:drug/metabolite transporter (DMT)-like permease